MKSLPRATLMSHNPREIENRGGLNLRVVWEDGHESVYAFRSLRQACPCAVCRDEWTGRTLLDPEGVPKDLKALGARPVGHYGLTFAFSDGHAAGIYTFQALRDMCPCGTCVGVRR